MALPCRTCSADARMTLRRCWSRRATRRRCGDAARLRRGGRRVLSRLTASTLSASSSGSRPSPPGSRRGRARAGLRSPPRSSCSLLAAAFLGPVIGGVAAVIAELAATLRIKTRWCAVVLHEPPAAVVPAVVAGGHRSVRWLAAGRPAPASTSRSRSPASSRCCSSFVMFAPLRRLVFPTAEQFGLRTLLEFLPSAGLSILVVVAGVGITLKVGNAGIAFALVGGVRVLLHGAPARAVAQAGRAVRRRCPGACWPA